MKSDIPRRINILNTSIDAVTMQETLTLVERAINNKKQIHHVVVNAAKIVRMQKDRELHDSVVNCDLINADGQAVVWASSILGKSLPERVAGVDLMQEVVKLADQKGYKIYFFGAKEEVVKQVVHRYSDMYSDEIIAGYRNGYFKTEEAGAIVKEIAESGADILFVAISSPKKEIFLNKHKQELAGVSFIMGVGGSFDVVAGKLKRAPLWMQKAGLEWCFRIYQEPGRMWKRYLYTNIVFIWLVIKALLSSGKQAQDSL